MALIFILNYLFFTEATAYPDVNCIAWFEKSKISKNSKECISKCSVLMIDLSTFLCRNQCPELCSRDILVNYIFYPGLTSMEKALIGKYPTQALAVFIKKNLAEESSMQSFPKQKRNDEGDAFRHFIWAAELTNELGAEVAIKFLNAHEEEPIQSPEEKEMDLANNQRGVFAAQIKIKNKNYNLKDMEIEALDQLRSKKLFVLKPGLEIPKEPK